MEVDGGTTNVKNINTFGKRGYQGELNEFRATGGGGTLGAFNTSTLTSENMHMYNQYKQFGGHEEMELRGTGMLGGQEHLFSRYRAGAFDGLALTDEFLEEYYSSVSISLETEFDFYII